jgi:hypothetical protein
MAKLKEIHIDEDKPRGGKKMARYLNVGKKIELATTSWHGNTKKTWNIKNSNTSIVHF